MRRTATARTGKAGRLAGIVIGWSAATAGLAQQADPPGAATADDADTAAEIVILGKRGSIEGDIAPLATLDATAIAATGATTMAELLRAIRSVTQTADGADPIFLLNAQRVSGYPEIGTLPPEAIEKVEVMPEPVALRFGYPPTRRVLNFITKRRFRQIEVRGTAGSSTRAANKIGNANLGLTRLRDDARLTLALEYRHSDAVRQTDRDIVPDPDVLFDAIGNVAAPDGGEIDPALSAAAGAPVTVAAVPDAARATIAGFAAGANRARIFDLGPYRTLAPRKDAVKAEAVLADRIGETLAGSISLSAEQTRERTRAGPSAAFLTVPGGNPYSPFARDVTLYRYLTEAPSLRFGQTVTTLHAGGTLRGAIAGWQWDASGTVDQQRSNGTSDRSIDTAAANAAIAAGANPFAPLAPALLAGRTVDRARLLTRTAVAKSVVTGRPITLPAGKVTLTATVEAERATATSVTRGSSPFALAIGRTRTEAGIALDVPISSRRDDVLAAIGDLSATASVAARRVGGAGTLHDSTYGLAWAPRDGVQILATIKRSGSAPGLAQLSTPVVSFTNVPVFDFAAGRTEIVTLLTGGNPDLLPERRRVRSLALNLKPFARREWRVSATYEAATIRDQTGTIYAVTPQTEALLPGQFVRDPAGRLVAVAYRPINFYRERQRTLNLTINGNGFIGKPPPPPPPPTPGAAPGAPPERATYYGGIGPSIKLRDRLELGRGAPALDLLRGDTVTGGGYARAFGYAYGGINYRGNGMTFDAWYGGGNRVRNVDPAADLRFAAIFKLNISTYVGVHQFLKHADWARKLQVKLDISNLTDARPQVRDRDGRIPNRFQPDYIDPVGRTVSLSFRKLF